MRARVASATSAATCARRGSCGAPEGADARAAGLARGRPRAGAAVAEAVEVNETVETAETAEAAEADEADETGGASADAAGARARRRLASADVVEDG
jgi:hypothetical protein